MRLIDADALKRRLKASCDPLTYHKGGDEIQIDILVDMIDEESTVFGGISVTEMYDAEEEKQRKKIEEIEYQNRKLRDKVYYQEGYQKGYADGFIAHQRLVEERDQ